MGTPPLPGRRTRTGQHCVEKGGARTVAGCRPGGAPTTGKGGRGREGTRTGVDPGTRIARRQAGQQASRPGGQRGQKHARWGKKAGRDHPSGHPFPPAPLCKPPRWTQHGSQTTSIRLSTGEPGETRQPERLAGNSGNFGFESWTPTVGEPSLARLGGCRRGGARTYHRCMSSLRGGITLAWVSVAPEGGA